jgi:hypothetical protein
LVEVLELGDHLAELALHKLLTHLHEDAKREEVNEFVLRLVMAYDGVPDLQSLVNGEFLG